MNKKIISMAVAAALVAPVVAQAADISFKGDARFRYGYVDNGVAAAAGMDNRVRMVFTAKDGDNMATARLTMDGAANDAGTVDYAYVATKIGPVALTMGDQRANFGSLYFVQNAGAAQRVTASVKAGPATVTYIDDIGNATAVDPGARVGTGVVSAKLAGFNVAVLNNETKTFIYAAGKAGPVDLAIESTDVNGAAGTYINVGMEVAGMDMGLTSIAMDAGLTTNKLYSPVTVLGTSNGGLAEATELTLLTVKKGNIAVGAGTADTLSLVDVAYTMGNMRFGYGSIGDVSLVSAHYNIKF